MANAGPINGGDTGSGEVGVQLPGGYVAHGNVTVSHSAFIILAALLILWLLGAVVFRSVRM